jgi:DNA topoisomerase-1
MPKPLVIVESPAKAKNIASILGSDFVVESSIGHIRDLPRNAADVPTQYRGLPWARDGVDCDNDFKPLYIVPREKKDQVSKLKKLLKDASELYLATDEDREGESISWHLLEVLSPRVPVRRMVFHEITRPAIERAVREWRDLDLPLVDAQETRRIADRLFGYRVSPVLWKRVLPGLSAGRVQSVATRIIVERERERMRFREASYWDIDATFTATDGAAFPARLASVGGNRVATGKDFTEAGEPARQDVVVLDEAAANQLVEGLRPAAFSVRSVTEKPYRSSPSAPFITSTLQQEAGRKLRFTASRTMQVAQRLYENGYITYMRTDSTTLSEQALTAARSQAAELYGPEYVPAQPRLYVKKVKNAQEAHEAIRPAGEAFRRPDDVAREVSNDEARLYDLIWKRTVASQMADAVGHTVSARMGAVTASGVDAEFSASGRTITFPGYLRAYVEGADDPDAELEDRETFLPRLAEGDRLGVDALDPKSHTTSPPARYTDASIIKRLEELGVGRPSTYASIVSTIQDRGYVWRKGSALVPSWVAFSVVNLLERFFPNLVDYGFTAKLEDDLDKIAGREIDRVPWLRQFYFGNGSPGLLQLTSERLDEIDPREINSIPIGVDSDGTELIVRVGRYGPYLQRGEDRASVPDDLAPDELTVERAEELLAAPKGDRVLGNDPETGLPVVAKAGRFGPYVQLGEIEDADGKKAKTKPKTASLFKSMSLDTVTLEDALRLLTIPRTVGVDPSDGAEIIATNGRYGPYLKKGTDSRSIESEDQLLTITLDEAVAVFAQPKQRRGQRSAAPLRELGADPTTGAAIVIKDGRFGAYITDGEYNVTVPRGETVEGITPERAAELLADKRAAGPPKGRKRGAAKKTAAKKAAPKKAAAKKTAAKKAAAKKAAPAKAAAEQG